MTVFYPKILRNMKAFIEECPNDIFATHYLYSYYEFYEKDHQTANYYLKKLIDLELKDPDRKTVNPGLFSINQIK